VGDHDFGGSLAGPMTAHPKVDPRTGEMVFFGYAPFPPYLRVHAADASGALSWTTDVELPGPVMMHDFVITETSVVIFDLPAVFDLQAILGGGEGIRWDPDHGARIGVLERGAPGETVRWTEVEPFWAFHLLNGHDDPGGGIVVEGCRADRLNTSFGPEELAEPVQPRLHRWRIGPDGTVTDEPLDDRAADFPRIDERRTGLPARYGYVGHTRRWDDDAVFDGVTKHDLRTGTSITHRFGDATVGGEPVFAPDPGRDGEDAGWILSWVHDQEADHSAVVVLDAAELDEVARVHLPRRVPFGFHGSWLPEAT
jgi:carotenoid cleavage dioxygenase-like enzyme